MEIECGDYVRVKECNVIGKVLKITSRKIYIDSLGFGLTREQIAKHSKNIIDLIEVGDYVNGKEVKQIAMFEGFPDYPKLIFTDKKYLIPRETLENKDIKTIITKEQMASIEYKVEEDKNEK